MGQTIGQPLDSGECQSFVRGTLRGAALVGALVVVGLVLAGRGGWAVGFACGALISAVNFRLIAHAVGGLTGLSDRPRAGILWKGALFRFAIAAAVLALAALVLHLSLLAVAAGLVVTQMTMITLWLARALRSLG